MKGVVLFLIREDGTITRPSTSPSEMEPDPDWVRYPTGEMRADGHCWVRPLTVTIEVWDHNNRVVSGVSAFASFSLCLLTGCSS